MCARVCGIARKAAGSRANPDEIGAETGPARQDRTLAGARHDGTPRSTRRKWRRLAPRADHGSDADAFGLTDGAVPVRRRAGGSKGNGARTGRGSCQGRSFCRRVNEGARAEGSRWRLRWWHARAGRGEKAAEVVAAGARPDCRLADAEELIAHLAETRRGKLAGRAKAAGSPGESAEGHRRLRQCLAAPRVLLTHAVQVRGRAGSRRRGFQALAGPLEALGVQRV
jgi:hypothetical protein